MGILHPALVGNDDDVAERPAASVFSEVAEYGPEVTKLHRQTVPCNDRGHRSF
jgi:hypothetical protein